MNTLIFFFLIITPSSPLSFNFTTFDPNNHDIKYEGHAIPLNNAIQLTENQHYITGHASYFEPVQLWDKATGNLASFVTNFTYSIDIQNNVSHSDGIAFFVANLHYRMPDIQQGSGIGLASGNQTLNSAANPFVAVEFDTYHNAWDDEETDHVGIDVSSLRSSKSIKWFSVLDGTVMDASIVYDSTTKNICAYFTAKPEGFIVQQYLCYEIDLRDYLPEWVVIGFSAATGMYSEFHKIHSWSFNSSFPSSIPPSSSSSIPPSSSPSRKDKSKMFMILMIVGWSLFLVVSLLAIYFYRRNKGQGETPAPKEDHIRIRTDTGSSGHERIAEAESEPDRSRRRGEVGIGSPRDEDVTNDQIREQREYDSASVNHINTREIENDLARVNPHSGQTQIDSSSSQNTREIPVIDSSSVGTSDLV